MREALFQSLRPVRGRQQSVFAIHSLFVGLLVSATIGLGLGVVRLAGVDLAWPLVGALLAVGPVVGLILGLALRRTWHDAAEAIDAHCGLKDRTVTALAFANQPSLGELHELQMTDAMAHLAGVEPKKVVPVVAPKTLPYALAGLAASAAMLLWPMAPREAEAGPAPAPDSVIALADKQKADGLPILKKLEEMFQDADDATEEEKQGIKDLIQKAKEKFEEMTQDGMSEQEALAKLSELSAEKQALTTMLNPAALEGALASLGTALAASQPFEGAGKALMKGDLDKAAKELDKLDEVKLTPKEAKDLEQKLREQQKKAGDAGQGSLGDAIGELADSINKGGGKSSVGKAGKNLAKRVNSAIRKRRAANLLDAFDENLRDGKAGLGENGGPKGKKPEKSNSPSSNWGRGVSGNTDGEKTKLSGKRTEQQITGTPSDEGESEVETTTTPEAREKARREYQEKFKKGTKESQAILESEPIPLGHRQTVKKYFESIRPSNAEAFETKEAPKPETK